MSIPSDLVKNRRLSLTPSRTEDMKNKLLLALILLSLGAQPVWALRCGQLLVLEGDYKIQVLQKCGEPTYQESRVEYRSFSWYGYGPNQPGLALGNLVPVYIDEWIYNFGPHRFMQLLTFENGRLVRIKDLDYGN